MQPLEDHNSQSTLDVSAASGGLLHVGKAPSALSRMLYRSMRMLRTTKPARILSSRVFQYLSVGAVCFGAGSFFLVTDEANDAGMVASLSSQAGFEASKLVIQGNQNIDLTILKQKLASQLGGSLFDFDVDEARKHIMASTWVKHAEIRKVYPDTVIVDLVEREPVALWKSNGVVNLISSEGNVIAEADINDMRLPQVVGKGANNSAAEFLSFIDQFKDITAQASAYVRVGDRRWNIHLKSGPKILLPEHNWKVALTEINELNFKKQLFERDIVQVDMRLPDRLVLKMSPEQAELRKTAIEKALKKKWHKI